jgi:hypothetical protein
MPRRIGIGVIIEETPFFFFSFSLLLLTSPPTLSKGEG